MRGHVSFVTSFQQGVGLLSLFISVERTPTSPVMLLWLTHVCYCDTRCQFVTHVRYFDTSCQLVTHVRNCDTRCQFVSRVTVIQRSSLYDSLSQDSYSNIMSPLLLSPGIQLCEISGLDSLVVRVLAWCTRDSRLKPILKLYFSPTVTFVRQTLIPTKNIPWLTFYLV